MLSFMAGAEHDESDIRAVVLSSVCLKLRYSSQIQLDMVFIFPRRITIFPLPSNEGDRLDKE